MGDSAPCRIHGELHPGFHDKGDVDGVEGGRQGEAAAAGFDPGYRLVRGAGIPAARRLRRSEHRASGR